MTKNTEIYKYAHILKPHKALSIRHITPQKDKHKAEKRIKKQGIWGLRLRLAILFTNRKLKTTKQNRFEF
jgi:hypothetical protein